MGGGENSWGPTVAPPPLNVQREEHWRHFDNSVNAVSFGFVATAILISMFLVMAIFERFLRSTSPNLSPSIAHSRNDIESQEGVHGKLAYAAPNMSVYARGVSVLMPGEVTPTFIAHPAPMPCPQGQILWPLHQPSSSTFP
ncbi:hypothetical protein RJ641_018243 [Dillenia turbinata]|uniref:Uncharacterized protein n=1 Tax=Dillenia turbinata TaxID=194707 RepID=A0AAN8YYE1_9MAGN